MGAGLVKEIFVRWGHLDPLPKILFIRMAVTIPDKHDPPIFWGGRVMMAAALGRVVPDAPTRGDRSPEAERARKERDDAFKAVERALHALRKAGAVILLNRPGPGERGQYQLCVSAPSAPRSPGATDPRSPGASNGEVPPGERPKCPPVNGGPRSTEQEENFYEEEGKDDGAPQVTTSPASPTGRANPDDPSPPEVDERARQVEALRVAYAGWTPPPDAA